jgi:menaquinol-cytochrome c reductase iron-sulfur subunit
MQRTVLTATPAKSKRRNFIISAIYAFPFLIGGTLATSVGTYLFGKSNAEPDGWADAGDVGDLQKNVPRQVSFVRSVVDGWQVQNEKANAWVILDDRQQVTAFSPLCTHLGCAYQWQTAKKAFTCPCHGSVFNSRGDVLAGPAGRPLDRYQVKIESNRLWLGPLQTQKDT